MIDPTKLKRAAFIAALQGWYLANFSEQDVTPVMDLLRANALRRSRDLLVNLPSLDALDQSAVAAVLADVEKLKVKSIAAFAEPETQQLLAAENYIVALNELVIGAGGVDSITGTGDRVYRRNAVIKGPMHAFDYSYLEDHLGVDKASALPLQGAVAYEALNLVDGKRSVRHIRHWLLAEFLPDVDNITLENVEIYLAALESIDVIR